MLLRPGDAIRVELTKWGDRPHWEFDGVYLGTDAAGDWIGFPMGSVMTRPGTEYVAPNNQVGLVPAPGLAVGRSWLATFHGPGGVVATYVDMTTAPHWDGSVVRAVDLDLDVIKTLEGEVVVDDEDEFAEHQVAFGYPDEIVELAIATKDVVLAAARAAGAAVRRVLPAVAGSTGGSGRDLSGRRPCGTLVGVRIDFHASAQPTLGVEWEFALVDRQTRDLRNDAAHLFARAKARLPDPGGCTRSS